MLDGRVRPPDPDDDPWRDEPVALTDETAAPPRVAAPPIAPPPASEAPAFARAVSNDLRTVWSKLDRTARLLAIASVAAILISLIGLPAGAWTGMFAFIVIVAAIVTFATAFLGSATIARDAPVALTSVELWATHVVAVLAILRALQAVFDLGRVDETGGVGAVVFVIALVVAAVALIIAFNQRGSDPYAALGRADQGTRLAAGGLALVLLGWAYNLSVSFWTMDQAALPLAVLTLATLVILEAPRIQLAMPAAWVGAGIGVFGAILLLGNWNALLTLGRTRLQLDPPDLVGFLAYTLGTALIIAGGFLSGRDVTAGTTGAQEPPPGGPSTVA